MNKKNKKSDANQSTTNAFTDNNIKMVDENGHAISEEVANSERKKYIP